MITIGELIDNRSIRLFHEFSVRIIMSLIVDYDYIHFDQYWYFIPCIPKIDYDKIDERETDESYLFR